MSRRGGRALALALVLAAVQVGCARPSWLPSMPEMPTISLPTWGSDEGPARSSEVEVVNSTEVTDFYTRSSEFYRRLEGRRFNSIASFRDAGLREYFGTDQSFVDYYADLADDLSTASFERSVPLHAEVQEFLVDAPGRARVKVRIVGEDGRPLRFWATSVEREDRWERREGRWWIVPGRS